MDKRGKRQSASIFGGMGFYIALLVCVIAAGVVGYRALLSSEMDPVEDPGEIVQNVDNTVNDAPTPVTQPDESDAQPVLSDGPLVVTRPVVTKEPEIETGDTEIETETPVSDEVSLPEEDPAPESVVSRIVSPLAGEMVAVFSVDRLMYDPTLGDWRTHDGIDIRAEAGTPVVATAAGTILSVDEDGRLGVTICIEHTGGYVTTYASLHPETFVEAGQSVEAGTVIGAVGNTSLTEAALGAHLHFSVSRNGESIDPEAYLPKES